MQWPLPQNLIDISFMMNSSAWSSDEIMWAQPILVSEKSSQAPLGTIKTNQISRSRRSRRDKPINLKGRFARGEQSAGPSLEREALPRSRWHRTWTLSDVTARALRDLPSLITERSAGLCGIFAIVLRPSSICRRYRGTSVVRLYRVVHLLDTAAIILLLSSIDRPRSISPVRGSVWRPERESCEMSSGRFRLTLTLTGRSRSGVTFAAIFLSFSFWLWMFCSSRSSLFSLAVWRSRNSRTRVLVTWIMLLTFFKIAFSSKSYNHSQSSILCLLLTHSISNHYEEILKSFCC